MMAHAQIYALANYTFLPALKDTSLRQIARALVFMARSVGDDKIWSAEITCDLTSVVRFVYENTNKLVSEDEPLRRFVSSFSADLFDNLDEMTVNELMGEGGDCVVDIISKVRYNLAKHRKRSSVFRKTIEKAQWSQGLAR